MSLGCDLGVFPTRPPVEMWGPPPGLESSASATPSTTDESLASSPGPPPDAFDDFSLGPADGWPFADTERDSHPSQCCGLHGELHQHARIESELEVPATLVSCSVDGDLREPGPGPEPADPCWDLQSQPLMVTASEVSGSFLDHGMLSHGRSRVCRSVGVGAAAMTAAADDFDPVPPAEPELETPGPITRPRRSRRKVTPSAAAAAAAPAAGRLPAAPTKPPARKRSSGKGRAKRRQLKQAVAKRDAEAAGRGGRAVDRSASGELIHDELDEVVYSLVPMWALKLGRTEFKEWRETSGLRELTDPEAKRLSQIRRMVLARVYAERNRIRKKRAVKSRTAHLVTIIQQKEQLEDKVAQLAEIEVDLRLQAERLLGTEQLQEWMDRARWLSQ